MSCIKQLDANTVHFLARLYESTGRAIVLPPASASASVSAAVSAAASALTKMLSFTSKFSRPYIF